MKWILRIKSRNKLMKVQVDRENRIKKQNQNYVIVEILLDGMNLYYRPWHVVDVYLSIMTLLFYVLSYDSLYLQYINTGLCPRKLVNFFNVNECIYIRKFLILETFCIPPHAKQGGRLYQGSRPPWPHAGYGPVLKIK